MNKLAIFGAAALVVGGLSAGALAAAPETEAEAEAEETSKQEKKICRTTKMTGSLTRRTRICMTEGEWRELAARTRRGVDEMNSAASGGKICVPDPADPFQGCPG
jgi:hypothetical protein